MMKAVLISGISIGSPKMFSDRLFFLNSSKRHIRLFINKKKRLVRFKLAFLFRKLKLLSLIELRLKISVNNISDIGTLPERGRETRRMG